MALGALLLLLRPRHSPQVFFGLFALTWGLQLFLMWLGPLLQDFELHYFGLLLGHSVMAVATLFLIHFAMILRRRPGYGYITAIVAVLAVVSNLVLITRPELIVESVNPTKWGPLVFPLYQAPQRIAFFLALFVVYLEYRRAKAGTPRRRLRGILMALALFVAYRNTSLLAFRLMSPGTFVDFAAGGVESASEFIHLADTVLIALLMMAFLGLVAHMILRPPTPEGVDSPLVFAFLFPATVAVLEAVLQSVNIPLETGGFWEILAVGVLVYTLANYQLFGLELKVKKYIGPVAAGVLVLFGIPTLLTLALGEFGVQAFSFAVIPQVVGVAGVVVFRDHVKSALFPGVDESPGYMHQRKLDIYRVALEEILQRGGSPDDPHLKELRLRHQITQQEHSIIAWMTANEQRPGGQQGDTSRLEVGQTVLGRYRLKRIIGHGSYGRTFLAQDLQSRDDVVVKTVDLTTFDGQAARLLLREARLAASLDHPFVIDILDVAELPDRVVVVMEYADSGNLEEHLDEQGRLSLSGSVRFARELLMALEAADVKGIVHRNMKPKNILLEADGSVRLSDFGAASTSQRDTPQETELATKTLQNILYQSPEQIKGEPASHQSDLFVAGILFHQALTLRHPFQISGKDNHQIREALTSQPPRLLVDDQPDWVKPFLEKVLAKDPAHRFKNATAMREHLEKQAGL